MRIESIKNQAKNKPDRAIETLMKLIEESIPVKSIYIKEAEEPESQGKPFEGLVHNDICALMQTVFDSLIKQGKSIEEVKAVIFNLEPFNHFPEYIETLTSHD